MARKLDVRGMRCPLPVLKTQKALRDMAAGDEIEVLATDPASRIDFRHFCGTAGHRLIAEEEAGDVLIYRIAKGG
ncbi:MAG: sulfurtransferase TusA family protein [Alphaproteobacteria bacterium]